MAYQQSKHLFQGMNRDLSEDKQKGIYYIDAHNIRITARENDTLLSVTNEKGNKQLNFSYKYNNDNTEITSTLGQYVGHAVLNNYLVLFTTGNDTNSTGPDNIWRIDLSNPTDTNEAVLLYNGNLGFNIDYPIETLVDYETEDIQKVYWTDGLNQPRVINIVGEIKPDNNTQFDFIPEVFPNNINNLNVTIEKLHSADGVFKAGTIQYFLTYFNRYGQESNVVWQSPLEYISPYDRGGNVSETVSNAFSLTITGLPKISDVFAFDYVRIYAIQHTSEDTDLIGRKVVDLPFDETIVFTDNGTSGESYNPSELYYIGGIPTAIGTMCQKDQTLFLGNIKLKSTQRISDNIKNRFTGTVSFISVPAYPADNANGKYYDYTNVLNQNGQPEYKLVSSGQGISTQVEQMEVTHTISTYKYLETYRFGFQLQDKYGNWSEPFYIGDIRNTVAPRIDDYTPQDGSGKTSKYIYLPITSFNLTTNNFKTLLASEGWVNLRPLVVLPNENERECVAQGVVNSTIYNLGDRETNSPFAQPDWFFRPMTPMPYSYIPTGNIGWSCLDNNNSIDSQYNDTRLPYKHNSAIRGKTSQFAEIEKLRINQLPPTGISENGTDVYPTDTDFFIDQSILTLNSPETNVFNTDNLKLRFIGIIDITGYTGYLKINTAIPPNDFYSTNDSSSIEDIIASNLQPTIRSRAEGYIPRYYQTLNNFTPNEFSPADTESPNYHSSDYKRTYSILGSNAIWFDSPFTQWHSGYGDFRGPSPIRYGFRLFPWQAEGSISTNSSPSKLERKVLSNLRYSSNIKYFNGTYSDTNKTNTILNYDLKNATYISETTNTYSLAKDGSVVYYSEIDKLLPAVNNDVVDKITTLNKAQSTDVYDWDIIVYGSCANVYTQPPDISHTASGTNHPYNYYNTLRRILSFKAETGHLDTNGMLYGGNVYDEIQRIAIENAKLSTKSTATHITYKNDNHFVLSLKDWNNTIQTILPRIYFTTTKAPHPYRYYNALNETSNYGVYSDVNNNNYTLYKNYPWDSKYNKIHQDDLIVDDDMFYYGKGIMFIGELYREVSSNVKFGGTSEFAIQQNVWIPAGDIINLNDAAQQTIYWTQGDTYFQRYDCLKTYPYSNESTNNIVEILSFMCESRINIAGRYDKNRGLLDNTFITNENFNLINKGYTQRNNFFSYKILDERFKQTHFKNQITWTKVKSVGALTDAWTNVTLQNTLNLDGDKGELVSLNKFNNNIVAFQPKGISTIKYNENVQIATTTGLPIELGNSGKVNGKNYNYENVGCQYKRSICDTEYGSLYFVDNFTKNIYKISANGLTPLTEVKGFKEWIENNNVNYKTFYDTNFKDVYFVSDTECLVYNSLLDQFVSFMDYQGTQAMFNLEKNFFAIYNNKVYHQFEGDYNQIYGQPRDYSITILDNNHPEFNKIFTNLEYRSDMFKVSNDDDTKDEHSDTFDTIQIWNEYQDSGEHFISTLIDKPYLSSLQKKFRVWRIQLPRDTSNGIDRINNTWSKITLKRKADIKDKKRLVLHDAIVGYYI